MFWQLARSFPFTVFRKIQHDLLDLEALLFGQSGLLELEQPCSYVKSLAQQYDFLRQKFNLKRYGTIPLKFFRLRPPNFPTIRLAQLSKLYNFHKQVFSSLMQLNNQQDFHDFFGCGTSTFWETHYTFKTASKHKPKTLSKRFIDLLVINAVIPVRYAHNKAQGRSQEIILSLLQSISSEQNSTVKRFQQLKLVSSSALDSQALLQLKSNYCDQRRCLHCAVGSVLLNRNV